MAILSRIEKLYSFIYFLIRIALSSTKATLMFFTLLFSIFFSKQISKKASKAMDILLKLFAKKKAIESSFLLYTFGLCIVEIFSKSVIEWIKPIFETTVMLKIENRVFRKYLDQNFPDFHKKGPSCNSNTMKRQLLAFENAIKILMLDITQNVIEIYVSFTSTCDLLEDSFFMKFLSCTFLSLIVEILFFKRLKSIKRDCIDVEQKIADDLTDYFDNFTISKVNRIDEYPRKHEYFSSKVFLKHGIFERTMQFQNDIMLILISLFVFINNDKAKEQPVLTLREIRSLFKSLSKLVFRLFELESKRMKISNPDIQLDLIDTENNTSIKKEKNKNTSYEPGSMLLSKKEDYMGPFIQIIDTSIFINDLEIIKKINLSIFKEEKIAIIGKNGSGKTSFLRFLLGFFKSKGILKVNGNIVEKLSEKVKIAYLPQNTALSGTIADYLKSDNESNLLESPIFEKLKIMEIIKSKKDGCNTEMSILSETERHLIRIAKTLTKKADVLLADEPIYCCGQLNIQNELMDMILSNQNHAIKIIVVHQMAHLNRFDTVYNVNNGTINVMKSKDFPKS